MSRRRIKRGMVLAAGLGKRMRPITDRLPKPLVEIAGQSLLDRVLDRFDDAGLERVIVNTHHLADQIAAHLEGRTRPKIVLSHEDTLLETGGGVAKALSHFGEAPFVVANSDALWLDGYVPAIERLTRSWDDKRMDALLLMHPTVAAIGYDGRGDYHMDPGGRMRRRRELEVAPFLYAGVQILHPRLFADAPKGRFSLNLLYDRAEEAGRLYGLRHDGKWFHVGTPDSIGLVEAGLKGLDPTYHWV
ncbi:MAG: nucleotidyltransferase family protein [Alphaproteobacteria bacterium]|nr:nucleotidyltransferase family protein [Alphaproteobacteria bacterium]